MWQGHQRASDKGAASMQNRTGVAEMSPEQREVDYDARLHVVEELGHNCVEITEIYLNQATQPWDTGSTHKRVVSVRPGHRVYESRVD
jgi:hypothetical protein